MDFVFECYLLFFFIDVLKLFFLLRLGEDNEDDDEDEESKEDKFKK